MHIRIIIITKQIEFINNTCPENLKSYSIYTCNLHVQKHIQEGGYELRKSAQSSRKLDELL